MVRLSYLALFGFGSVTTECNDHDVTWGAALRSNIGTTSRSGYKNPAEMHAVLLSYTIIYCSFYSFTSPNVL